ncbi:hypothetical protein HK101_005009 [Irineochytrium annulatum]|nr:hypothetical protein HK101_005009 [Irineochytrium annulatum]
MPTSGDTVRAIADKEVQPSKCNCHLDDQEPPLMPRVSDRQILLEALQLAVQSRTSHRKQRESLLDEDPYQDEADARWFALYTHVATSRYLELPMYENQPTVAAHVFSKYMDRAFHDEFQLEKDSFRKLHYLIKDHPVFESRRKKKQTRSDGQLLVVLNRLGAYGNGKNHAHLGRYLNTSIGSVVNFTERVFTAILSLMDEQLKWPDAEERKEIAARIEEVSGFPGCVGFPDGTLFPLCAKPPLCGEEYYCRKGFYAFNGLVICDDQARIRYVYAEYRGSLSNGEYLLGDSAYTPHVNIIPAFKKPARKSARPENERFNTQLAYI